MKSSCIKLWNNYKLFIENAVQGNSASNLTDITHWRERLFINAVVYAMPFSLIALVPCIIVTYSHGHLLVPVFDIVMVTTVCSVLLSKSFTPYFKRAFLVVMLYLLAIILIASLGAFGLGSIYLLATGVIMALSFSKRITYASVAINLIIYSCFTCIIYFKLFDSPLIKNYSIGYWVDYSLNFMFLDMVLVLLVCNIINGLEGAAINEARLLKELQLEVAEKLQWHEMLKESEGHYKSLFYQNPSPMWIFDNDTSRFLQVNDAAISRYGYSKEDFLSMTIDEIRHDECLDDILDVISNINTITNKSPNHKSAQLITQHRRKNGEVFYVDVRQSPIPFEGREARLVIARNIDAQIEHTRAIEKQNARMREIAFMQSHIVRAPLARILGLTDLITKDPFEKPDGKLLSYLEVSARELDHVIREIVNNTEEALSEVNKNLAE